MFAFSVENDLRYYLVSCSSELVISFESVDCKRG